MGQDQKVRLIETNVVLDKRHRVLILARILLAVPSPAFLVFSAVQHMQAVNEDTSTAWELPAASFTQRHAGKLFAIFVGLIALPLWILSLLVAQIEEKRPGSLQEWLVACDEQRLGSFPSGWLKAFCKTEGLSVSGNKAEVIGRVKEWLMKRKDEDAPKKKSTLETMPIDMSTPTTESTEAKTPKERLVSLWKYFRGLLKWDPRIWSWPKAFEAVLFWGCVYGYAVLYGLTTPSGVVLMYMAGTPIALLIVNMVTKTVRSIIDYQYDQKVAYHTFVNLQAFRLSIHTIFGVCVATYGQSAMSRLVIPSYFDNFFELSLDVSCTDRDAFWTAFEASAANASCPALPNCGYASFEDLCQAVQYTPMLRAVGVDVSKVLLFNCIAWVFISLLVFGTGRASPTNGYAHLLSRHMIVAMMLSLAQLVSALYAFMRLLLLVPLLRLPRPAAYFDRTDSMARELPLYFYGPFLFYDFWATIFVYVLIAVALNFDFFKTYASRLRRVDEGQEQKAIDELKTKMRQMKKNETTGEMECEWSDEAPYFWFMPAQIVLECRTRSLPPMQTLRAVGHLEKKRIPLSDAFNQAAGNEAQGIDFGDGIDVFKIKDILFVSHRWEEPGRPDVNGVQLEAIKAYLEKHPEIEWVWFDYSSMPQKIGGIDKRTREEKAEFQLMLTCIADLYLTASVLILLDGSYASRFWTLTEAWCSMQTATAEGLVPSTEENRRYTIKHIHTADDKHDVQGLVDKVSKKTVAEIVSHLENPDVNVTNAKDKETMLPVIRATETRILEGFKNGFQKLQSPQSPPSGSTPASPKSGKHVKGSQVAPSDSNSVTALNDQ
jgi:hypothetical protein